MGIFDDAKQAVSGNQDGALDKAKNLINEHQDKVDQGIEKAGDALDERTGNKFTGQVDKGQQVIEDRTGNL